MSTAEPGGQGGFENSLAAFLHQPANLAGNRLRPESLSGAGHTLPPGGKELPLPTAMPDLAARAPELSTRTVPAGESALMAGFLEKDAGGSTMLPVSHPNSAGPQVATPVSMTLEHAAQVRSTRENAAMPATPRLAGEGARLTALPAGQALPPVGPQQFGTPTDVPTDVAGDLRRQALPGGRILALPDAGTTSAPVAGARIADALQPDAADSHLSQLSHQGASLAAPAVLRDRISDQARSPLQDGSLQAELFDRKATLAGTAPPPSLSTPATHAAPATVSVSAPAVPQPLQLLNPIDLPPGANGWSDSLGDRVVMMAGNKIQSAEIRLNPAELGPLRVQISVDDGTATVNFHAQHPLTRDAIEQALPRLREMLSDQGLSLGDTNVSDHGVPHDQPESERHSKPSETIAADNASMGIAGDSLSRPTKSLAAAGMIDLFA